MKLSDLKHRNDFGSLLNAMGLKGFGVEVGVAYGENAQRILNQWKGMTLFLVDPWNRERCGEYIDGSANIDFDGAFNNCMARMTDFVGRTAIMRMTSDEAADFFYSQGGTPCPIFDFVYLDGNHHNPTFLKDLLRWWPLVKNGGIFAGHDYYDLDTEVYKCEVKKTVDLFAEEVCHEVHETPLTGDQSWWIQKTGHHGLGSKSAVLKFLSRLGYSLDAANRIIPLEEVPQEEGDDWVSVEKGLPLAGQKVEAKYVGVYESRVVTFWRDGGGRGHFGKADEEDGKGSQPATHWRRVTEEEASETGSGSDETKREESETK